jgi:hypothetical protein
MEELKARGRVLVYVSQPTVLLKGGSYYMVIISVNGFGWNKGRIVGFHLPGLMGTPRHLDMQKIRIIGFFFENKVHWQFKVRLLLFTECTCV